MIEHVFSAEMMQVRERQLIQALLDCAGVYYDVNFSQDRILGNPIQIVDGVEYPILELIGKPKNCTYSEIIDYWVDKMPVNEREPFATFSEIARILACYQAGERELVHRFWTFDVLGNRMLAEQKILLYEDCTNGDVLGLVYVINRKEQEAFQQREALLTEMFESAKSKVAFWESVGVNIPGGYHRCSTDDGFQLEFVSDSFLDIVGWTREELEQELDNQFIQIVAPEDRDFFMAHEEPLVRDGRIDLAYRIRRKDGTRRWVQDATIRMEQDGEVFYQCTLADITDYVERLNEEKARAEASNLAKSTFLFNASHDIRTPMNAIQGFAHMIEENADNPEMVRETVHKIHQASHTLMTLLNDVLELSRIERGKDNVDEQPLNMLEHADRLHEMFAAEMESAGVTFVMENELTHPHVLADEIKLTRIAMNLLSNAKKFTPSGGTVAFGIRESDYDGKMAVYELFVRDTGIGMSHEFQKRAFEQFERERSSTESGVGGSGLGLAIIKRLCDLMQGECRIESELGQGSLFTVTIPLTVAADKASDEGESWEEADLTGRRVLLVEDNDFNREIAKFILEKMGIVVEEAADGSEAVDRLLHAKSEEFDVVLMDIQMPVMDGYTATQEIRRIADPQVASIPIVAMTANAFKEDTEKCLEIGMNGHLSKPIDAALLFQELAKQCRKDR